MTRKASHFKQIKTEDDAEDKNGDESKYEHNPKPPCELRRSGHIEDYV
jgi:hypothetical protein